MSIVDSLQITTSDQHLNDPYSNFDCSKRGSISSIRSGISISSPYESPGDFLSFNEEPIQRRPSKKGVSTFISKLYSMVEDGNHQNLISWSSTGTSFFVCNATLFAQEVLPEFFKHSNFSSFVRLLNMYGFHKINKSPRGQRGTNENEVWEFSHPKFQHGRSEMLKDIKRKAMDSELLRRETGDIHASFAMLQMSQADLLQQFCILQDNFSNLLQGFKESKKIQMQQQAIIQQLAERQGLSSMDILQDIRTDEPIRHNSISQSPLTVFVTSPAENSTTSSYNPMQFMNDNNAPWDSSNLQHPLQTTPDVTMSMYDTSNSSSPSPISPHVYNAVHSNNASTSSLPAFTENQLKYGNSDINALGLSYSAN